MESRARLLADVGALDRVRRAYSAPLARRFGARTVSLAATAFIIFWEYHEPGRSRDSLRTRRSAGLSVGVAVGGTLVETTLVTRGAFYAAVVFRAFAADSVPHDAAHRSSGARYEWPAPPRLHSTMANKRRTYKHGIGGYTRAALRFSVTRSTRKSIHVSTPCPVRADSSIIGRPGFT